MNDHQYNQYTLAQKQEIEAQSKYEEFLTRISAFSNMSSLSEAKDLATKILPTNQEITSFYVGNAKCVVVNKSDLLRISVDSAKEFICYDFQ